MSIAHDIDNQPQARGAVVPFAPPRLPYHDAIKERFNVDKAGWNALIGAIYPNAKTTDAVCMALSYCRARSLDPFKRPVHIVPMWSSAVGQMVETVWPGISELRTTAFRTGQFAGMSEPEFGPVVEMTLAGKATKGPQKGQERSVTMKVPEWCRITITRELNGKERRFVGPKVYFMEAYAKWADTDVPNDMWQKRPIGQLEKCAEAAALRRAFPEEIGNDLTAEEMEGQRIVEHSAASIAPVETPPAPPPRVEHKPSPPMQPVGEVVEADAVELVQNGHRDPTPVEWTEEEPPAPPQTHTLTTSELPRQDHAAVSGDPLDIPPALRRTREEPRQEKPVVNAAGWLNDLGRQLSTCEDLAALGAVQMEIQTPMKGRVSAADWARSQTMVMEAFHRINGDETGEEA